MFTDAVGFPCPEPAQGPGKEPARELSQGRGLGFQWRAPPVFSMVSRQRVECGKELEREEAVMGVITPPDEAAAGGPDRAQRVRVYDAAGRRVAVLVGDRPVEDVVRGTARPGVYILTDESGRTVARVVVVR